MGAGYGAVSMDDLHEDFRGALEAYLEAMPDGGLFDLHEFAHLLGVVLVEVVESAAPEGADVSATLLDLAVTVMMSLIVSGDEEDETPTIN